MPVPLVEPESEATVQPSSIAKFQRPIKLPLVEPAPDVPLPVPPVLLVPLPEPVASPVPVVPMPVPLVASEPVPAPVPEPLTPVSRLPEASVPVVSVPEPVVSAPPVAPLSPVPGAVVICAPGSPTVSALLSFAAPAAPVFAP